MQRIKLQQARQAHKLRSILSTHVSNACFCAQGTILHGGLTMSTRITLGLISTPLGVAYREFLASLIWPSQNFCEQVAFPS
jgi:hypothetical protein